MAGARFSCAKGRKKKLEITEEILEEVKMLLEAGMTQQQIYGYYNIDDVTWGRYKRDNPELDEIVRTAKMRTTAKVAGHLLQLCEEGNVSSIIFYLRTQGRWSEAKDETPPPENKPEEKKVITVTDPIEAAKIYQEFMLKS